MPQQQQQQQTLRQAAACGGESDSFECSIDVGVWMYVSPAACVCVWAFGVY